MILDTNILIALLAGEEKARTAVTYWATTRRSILISTVTITEILAFPAQTPRETEEVIQFLRDFGLINFDRTIAECAGALRRRYAITFADACIAATAISRQLPLVTRDKGFRKITELTVIEI